MRGFRAYSVYRGSKTTVLDLTRHSIWSFYARTKNTVLVLPQICKPTWGFSKSYAGFGANLNYRDTLLYPLFHTFRMWGFSMFCIQNTQNSGSVVSKRPLKPYIFTLRTEHYASGAQKQCFRGVSGLFHAFVHVGTWVHLRKRWFRGFRGPLR